MRPAAFALLTLLHIPPPSSNCGDCVANVPCHKLQLRMRGARTLAVGVALVVLLWALAPTALTYACAAAMPAQCETWHCWLQKGTTQPWRCCNRVCRAATLQQAYNISRMHVCSGDAGSRSLQHAYLPATGLDFFLDLFGAGCEVDTCIAHGGKTVPDTPLLVQLRTSHV